MANLFKELSRRNVFRVAVVYVVAAWVSALEIGRAAINSTGGLTS